MNNGALHPMLELEPAWKGGLVGPILSLCITRCTCLKLFSNTLIQARSREKTCCSHFIFNYDKVSAWKHFLLRVNHGTSVSPRTNDHFNRQWHIPLLLLPTGYQREWLHTMAALNSFQRYLYSQVRILWVTCAVLWPNSLAFMVFFLFNIFYFEALANTP